MIKSITDLVIFLKQFHRHRLADPALAPDLIPDDFPEGLGLVYHELGALIAMERGLTSHWQPPFATQDTLLPLDRVERVDGMLEFAWENQGNWSARCPVGLSDPPVFSNAAELWEPERRGFEVVCESLNHFLTTLCLQEAVMSCVNLIAIKSAVAADQVLTVPVRPLWLDGRYVSGHPDYHFYVSDDHEFIIMDGVGLWVGSNRYRIDSFLMSGIKNMIIN
jgi:hypothetical protein